MRKIRLLVLAVLVLGLVFILNSRLPAAEAEKISDTAITRAVESALYLDEVVSAHLVDVETGEGVVTLSGTVDNILARERATKVAETIKGVRSVVNRIAVACIIKPDNALERDIKAALAEDPATESYQIAVDVEDGVVTLEGEVDSWDEKEIAGIVAMGVAGVRDLNNRINIDYKGVRTDQEIKAEIERRLELDPYVYEGMIDVQVESGRVSLSGIVGSAAERTHAVTDAWVTGVTGVDAGGLEVRWWAKEDLKRESRISFATDSEVKRAVMDALRYDPRTAPYDFGVSVEERDVTLTGVTDNLAAKTAAGENAKNTIGVSGVDNFIKVRPEVELSTDRIAQNVERALKRDPLLERYTLTPIVRNQKVYLYGTVDTFCDRQRAVNVASRVWGVVAVRDNLKVAAAETTKSDEQIKEDIESELFWSFFVDSDNVEVSVEDGVATLTGVVTSWQELKAAVENAFDGGAVGVESELVVHDMPRYTPTYYRPRYNRPVP
jgi:osmotically-inducible protein OsmY